MTSITTICCAFCQGRGKDPFGLLSELSICQVCLGRRHVTVAVPYTICPTCGGSGAEQGTRLVCTMCGGKGVVSQPKQACRS